MAIDPLSAITSRSGTIAAGGTAQALMAANTKRRGFAFQNSSAVDMWINFLGATALAAQPSLKIPAGAYYETPPGGCPVAAVSLICATTSSAFSCWEW